MEYQYLVIFETAEPLVHFAPMTMRNGRKMEALGSFQELYILGPKLYPPGIG